MLQKHIRPFLDVQDFTWWSILGLLTIAMISTAIYEFATDPTTFNGGQVLAIVLLNIIMGRILYSLIRAKRATVDIAEDLKVLPHAGLILLASPYLAASMESIKPHLPKLKHCWIIATAESQKTATQLKEKYTQVEFHHGSQYEVDPDYMQSTYEIASRILSKEIFDVHLQKSDVIADITGGMKPMTGGLTLACLQHSEMQYVKSVRNPKGDVEPYSYKKPIRIDATFAYRSSNKLEKIGGR